MGWNKTPSQLAESLRKRLENSEEAILKTLHRIGMEATNWAKENGSYNDQTTNLRNSIGYCIYKDGQMMDFIFNPVQKNAMPMEAYQSAIRGQTVWEKDVPEKGYTLIVFAGMEYGIFVEAKGYVVLSGSLQHSKTAQTLDKALKKAGA